MEESVTDTSLSRFLIELKSRLRLLRRLNYVDNENVILPKGRLACEIDALDELVTTEIIVDGAFNDLDECETAALVSCLHTENERNAPAVPPSLVGPLSTASVVSLQTSMLRSSLGSAYQRDGATHRDDIE